MNDPCYTPSLMTVDEAINKILDSASALTDIDQLPVIDALNRVLAEDITSTINVPGYDNSAMDGYAVRQEDCELVGAGLKVAQRISAGSTGKKLEQGTAARIFTGAPIPENANAVVMQEHCEREGDTVFIKTKVSVGQNIRRAGEDIASGSIILEKGKPLRPQELGLAASVGIKQLSVVRKLRVATFFTGDELVEPGNELQDGQIYNSNRYTLRGLLQACFCEVTDLGIVPDTLEATRDALQDASKKADLVITSGGVSVGEEDYVRVALEELGELSMWRIAMKPGKPVAYGKAGKTLFMGLPGNPVSVFVTFVLFARPLILKMQGVTSLKPMSYMVQADFEWHETKYTEYLRARMIEKNGVNKVQIYSQQGSGVLSSASWANGLVEIKPNKKIEVGQIVKFIPFDGLL